MKNITQFDLEFLSWFNQIFWFKDNIIKDLVKSGLSERDSSFIVFTSTAIKEKNFLQLLNDYQSYNENFIKILNYYLDDYKIITKHTCISDLYYECHITIEPVFEERLEQLTKLAKEFNFKPANLLMQKRKDDTPEKSKYDTFCTGHSKEYQDLTRRMLGLINSLNMNGYSVWRYKIEDTLCDSKINDVYGVM